MEAGAYATTDRALSDRALTKLEQLEGAWYQVAEVRALRHETDPAFAAIARAWNMADPGLVCFKKDPLLASLRPDPRFAAWISKIGYP